MGFKIDTWAPHIYYDISEAKCLQRKLLPLTGSPFFSASSFLKAIPFALNEFFFNIRLLIISQQAFAKVRTQFHFRRRKTDVFTLLLIQMEMYLFIFTYRVIVL